MASTWMKDEREMGKYTERNKHKRDKERVCVCVRERERGDRNKNAKEKKRKDEAEEENKKKSVSDRIWEAKCKQVRINNQAYEKKYKNKQ